ncbi:hypothetical protein JTB14_023123 [Gonioctena quinquepunctata]|nr:hypothetical protein JTB14_023123 [Gonioctena quinquepunctata]
MLREFCVVFVFLALLSTEIHGRPSIRSGLKNCFGKSCPKDTFACSRHSTMTDDKKKINEEIRCLDLHNTVLDKFSSTKPNPFGPNVFFQGYSYTAAYEYSNDSSERGDFGNTEDVETNVVNGKESDGNSEIDDLNKVVDVV